MSSPMKSKKDRSDNLKKDTSERNMPKTGKNRVIGKKSFIRLLQKAVSQKSS